MAKKLILSKSDPTLERLVESVLVEILDDEHSFIGSVEKEYINDKRGIVFSTTIRLSDYSLDLNDVYSGVEITPIIDKLDLLSTLFKQFKRACRKIEEEGYNTLIYFNTNSVVINIVSKEAIVTKPIKIKPDVTLRKFEFRGVYSYPNPKTLVPIECEEHYIINCFGGTLEGDYNELLEIIKLPKETVKITSGQIGEVFLKSRVKLIGWETPLPQKLYDVHFCKSDCFKVTVQDLNNKKLYKMYGYLFKETLDEFNRRLCEYAERAIKVMSDTNIYRRDCHIPFTIGTHYMECESVLSEAQRILETYDEDTSLEIVEKCEEHAFRIKQSELGQRIYTKDYTKA